MIQFQSQAKPLSSYPIRYAEKGTFGQSRSVMGADAVKPGLDEASALAAQIRSLDNVEGLDLDPQPGPVELSAAGLQRLHSQAPVLQARLAHLDSKTVVFETVTHDESTFGAIQGDRVATATVTHFGGPGTTDAVKMGFIRGLTGDAGNPESYILMLK